MCTSWGGEGGEDIDRSENMRGWMKGMMKDGTEMKGVHEVQEGTVEGTSWRRKRGKGAKARARSTGGGHNVYFV